jgi:hypothetical protein
MKNEELQVIIVIILLIAIGFMSALIIEDLKSIACQIKRV